MKKLIAKLINHVLYADPIWWIVSAVLFVAVTAALLLQP